MKNALFICLLFLQSAITAQGFICAVGGGSEDYNDWSNAPYQWMVQRGRGGKVIILSVNDETTWLPTYFKSLGAREAVNFKIASRAAADSQLTYEAILSADVVFIKGGDQWNYINYWRQTKTESAIVQVYNRGGVIGGTSAGAMVLGGIDFTAQTASITSKEALFNILAPAITLDTSFIPLLPGVLFDTHVLERGRFGRSIAFLANKKIKEGQNILVAGIDDATAICIDSLNIGTVMGSGAVSFYTIDSLTKITNPAEGYIIENLHADHLVAGWQYDFNQKRIVFVPASAKTVQTPRQLLLPSNTVYVTGSNAIAAQISYLPAMLQLPSTDTCIIIATPGYTTQIAQVVTAVQQQQKIPASIVLSSSTANDSITAKIVASASCFIFMGDSVQLFAQLADTVTIIGKTFQSVITVKRVPLFFFGNAGRSLGSAAVTNSDYDYLTAWRGKMIMVNGLGAWKDIVYQPRIFENSTFAENRTSAMAWGAMRSRAVFGIYSDGNACLKYQDSLLFAPAATQYPAVIYDYRNTSLVDSSVYRASSSIGPRQAVAQNNVRINVTKNPFVAYSCNAACFVPVTRIDDMNMAPVSDMKISAYPNPFNPSVTLRIHNALNAFLHVKIYDVLGKEIAVIAKTEALPGEYMYTWNADNFPSGVYFAVIQQENIIRVTKLLLLK